MAAVLEAREITKRFPGVIACDRVNFDLRRGEIHGLLGENGAGKTTLMNVLSGACQPDGGHLAFDGEPVFLTSPHDAIARSVGMVHQHFTLVPQLTVVENIMLGSESLRPATRFLGRFALLDRKAAAARIRELSHHYGLEVDPAASVKDLSVGGQQRVEILKALYRRANILIFDEPTAVLTPREADDLFLVMRGLAGAGAAIVFITHKLREVLGIADRISVMRSGKMVGTADPLVATPDVLAEMMVGRKVVTRAGKPPSRPGAVVLRVKTLRVRDGFHAPSVDGVSLEVRAGEVLGIAGVLGNGQSELVSAIAGLRRVSSGTVELLGEDITGATTRRIIERGVAHVPEDRRRDGLVLGFPVRDNLVLCTYYTEPFAHCRELDEQRIDQHARALVQEYDIRTPGIMTSAGALSGGNRQKVVLAREFDRTVHLLIVNQPTRGLDVGSVEFVHRRILAARERGVAVLLVSADLDEVLTLSDRVAVLYRGRVVGNFDAGDSTRERLGLLMAGGEDGRRAE